MASKPYEIRWSKVEVGMQIAVERRGGYAWRLADVLADPGRHDWRVVIGKDRDGPVIDKGGPGVNGSTVVVRLLDRDDRDAIAALVQHIRNAEIARDRDSRDKLRDQLARLIARLR